MRMAEPDEHFRTILLDPPWPERGGGKIKRGADRHYPVISTRSQMLRTILNCEHWPDAGDRHIYMWATDNYLTWALWLLDAFGAKLHRTIPWQKTRMGLGQYFRGCHELLLFATIGKGFNVKTDCTMRTDALLGIDWKGRHSEKPPQSYELIEARSKGPYLEMFARSGRDGWTSWGNEMP